MNDFQFLSSIMKHVLPELDTGGPITYVDNVFAYDRWEGRYDVSYWEKEKGQMPTLATLPLTGIIDVIVSLKAISPVTDAFNSALIMSDSMTSTVDGYAEVREYASLTELAEDFNSSTNEYKAASLYFAQNPSPKKVFVGLPVDGQTFVEEITGFRQVNDEWYGLIPTHAYLAGLADGDGDTVAQQIYAACDYVEAMSSTEAPIMMFLQLYLGDTNYDPETLMTALSERAYQHTFAYLTTNLDEEKAIEIVSTPVSAVAGWALGNNTSVSPAYNLRYKQLTGLTTERGISTLSQLTSWTDRNINLYANRGKRAMIERGRVLNGFPFDEVIYLDNLVYDIKQSVLDVFTTTTKVPYTEVGVSMLSVAIAEAIQPYANRGFVAPGVWNGETVLNLNNGDALSKGYLIQFEPVADQSVINRANRIAPPCFVSLKLAGAIESITINVIVDR